MNHIQKFEAFIIPKNFRNKIWKDEDIALKIIKDLKDDLCTSFDFLSTKTVQFMLNDLHINMCNYDLYVNGVELEVSKEVSKKIWDLVLEIDKKNNIKELIKKDFRKTLNVVPIKKIPLGNKLKMKLSFTKPKLDNDIGLKILEIVKNEKISYKFGDIINGLANRGSENKIISISFEFKEFKIEITYTLRRSSKEIIPKEIILDDIANLDLDYSIAHNIAYIVNNDAFTDLTNYIRTHQQVEDPYDALAGEEEEEEEEEEENDDD